MSTTVQARTARKPRRCGNCQWSHALRGVDTIAPGHRYLRHVAFPGDEANGADTPWVIAECVACACDREPSNGLLMVNACSTFCCGDVPCAKPFNHKDGHSCRRCYLEATS